MKKLFCMLSFVALLANCAPATTTGTIYTDGQARKIVLEEYTTNGISLVGFSVTIDGEYLGVARRDKFSGFEASKGTVTFIPLQTKYGELTLKQNVSLTIGGSEISADLMLDGVYIGSIQMPLS